MKKHKMSKKCWCKPKVISFKEEKLRPSLSWGDALLFIQKQDTKLFIRDNVIKNLVATLENIKSVTPKKGAINEWCGIVLAYAKEKLG